MPLHPKRAVIAHKVQSVAGTAETLTASEAAFNAYESDASPSVEFGVREGQGAFSRLVSVAGKRVGTIRFQTDLYTAPAWESMLGSAGFDEGSADVWNVDSDPAQWTVSTIARYMDGKVYRLRDAMANLTLQLRAGQVTRCLWEFMGPIDAWGVDAAILAPTYPTAAAAAPTWRSSTLTLGGNSIKVSAIDIALNNAIAMLEDPTAAAGVHRAWIGDRAVGGTIDPEEELAATRDDHGIWLTPTEQALSIAYGSMSISVPKLQFINLQQAARNGAAVLQATWQGNRSAAAGDDELVIDLST